MERNGGTDTGVHLDATERLKAAALGMKGNAAIKAGGKNGEQPTPGTADMQEVRKIIADWPATSKKAAETTINTYGAPNEAMASRLIWYNNGVWKRTIAYRDEIIHNFPEPHVDCLENFLDYKVPPEKFGELGMFEGSIILERTKGEISARCDMEAANTLSLNMLHEIVTGKRSAEEAREKVAEQMAAYVMNRPAPYAEKLQFTPPQNATNDPDEMGIGEDIANQLKEKIKEVLD